MSAVYSPQMLVLVLFSTYRDIDEPLFLGRDSSHTDHLEYQRDHHGNYQGSHEGLSLGDHQGGIQRISHGLHRQQVSLPSLLLGPGSYSDISTHHLTQSQSTELLLSPTHSSRPPSTSQGSSTNLVGLMTASDLADLDPEIRRTLLGSDQQDLAELQISHV